MIYCFINYRKRKGGFIVAGISVVAYEKDDSVPGKPFVKGQKMGYKMALYGTNCYRGLKTAICY